MTDLAGNRLDGNGDGTPGGNFVRSFGLGQTLSYPDSNRDLVTLRLTGGGVMELIRGSDGEGERLRLLGPHAGVSVLSGTVRRPTTGGDGITHVLSLTGITGVQNRLTNPPFVVSQISAVVVDALLASGEIV